MTSVSSLVMLTLLTLLALPRVAFAAPSLADKAAAQALFEEGFQLMGSKHYAEACPKLEESERLDPALGTRFRLAECDEGLGRRASAWAGFLEVADLAKAGGQADREALARSRAAALEPRIAKMRIVVAAPDTPGLEVARGATPVGRGQWGTALPMDPGTYELSATAPGMRPWRGTVTVPDEGAVITASIPALAPAPAVVAAPSPAVVVAPVAPRADDHPGSGARIAGVAFMGIGGAAMITSVVLGVVAKSNYNEAGNNCGASSCNSSGKSTIDDARSLGNLATGVFIGGAVVAAAGVVVFIVAPSASRSSASASLRVGPGSAWLEGSF